ncbi:MAG: ATP-dependent Clp protease ATP-binding subunit, partial [Planctomycetia bacterium]|nr:ATP-dependent Clp protease ATP-binding subunit [Planctomycetia bacterium]
KAIDVLDEAGARVRLQTMVRPPELKKIDEEIEEINREKGLAVASQDFEEAASLRDKVERAKDRKRELTRKWRESSRTRNDVVDEAVVTEVISRMTGIPVTRVSREDSTRLLRMEDELHRRVVSQNEAISAVARVLRRSRSGLADPRRPIGSFIFAGPTGVGKTLLAKVLTEFMFGDEDALVQIDMSEFMEKHCVSKLVGAPPGYVGHEEGGQLTEKIRRRPYAVVLFDEIEKAHPEVFNMLLQLLEEGRLTDSFGRHVDFRNTIVVMTTNAGAEAIRNESGFGFQKGDDDSSYESMKKRVMEQIDKSFRPEFLNRVNDVIIFRHLTQEDLSRVVDLELANVRERLRERNLVLVLSDGAKDWLVKKGANLDYGARPLRRAIENYVEDPLSEEILNGEFEGRNTVTVDVAEVGGKEQLRFSGSYVPRETASGYAGAGGATASPATGRGGGGISPPPGDISAIPGVSGALEAGD